MFDAKKYLLDNNIELASQSHKHARPGWIQIKCLFCTGNPGFHLGYNLQGGFFNCWRCGWHSYVEIIKTISNVGWQKAKDIAKKYDAETEYETQYKSEHKQPSKLILPYGTNKLKHGHIQYLKDRNFNPEQLQIDYNIQATGPIGDYKHRIIIPITFNETLVSFQGRDFTEKSKLRYKACEKVKEVIHHKHTLYGLDDSKKYQVILVEGVTDKWRFGSNCVCGFGIEMKQQQINLLAERFAKVFIMFDDDPQAIEKAKDIGNMLDLLGIESEICVIKGDPGELDQKTANQYKRELIGE